MLIYILVSVTVFFICFSGGIAMAVTITNSIARRNRRG